MVCSLMDSFHWLTEIAFKRIHLAEASLLERYPLLQK